MKTKMIALLIASLFSCHAYSEECGDSMMTKAFTTIDETLGPDQDIGTVEAFYNTQVVKTQYRDVYCDQGQLVVSYTNGGRLVFESYWGTYIYSPQSSSVQAFIGTLTMPGAPTIRTKFWIEQSSGGAFGFDLNNRFTLRSRWF